MPYTQGQVKRFAILTKNFQKCKQLITKHSAVCNLDHRRLNVYDILKRTWIEKNYSSMSFLYLKRLGSSLPRRRFLFSSYSEYVPSKK